MMKKGMFVALTSLVLYLFVSILAPVVSTAVAEEKAVSDVIVWENEAKTKTITFKHADHSKLAEDKCVVCHHKSEGDATKIAKCVTCHPKKTEGPDDKRVNYKRAMHKQCKDCHKKSNKGPYKKCSECHIKADGAADEGETDKE